MKMAEVPVCEQRCWLSGVHEEQGSKVTAVSSPTHRLVRGSPNPHPGMLQREREKKDESQLPQFFLRQVFVRCFILRLKVAFVYPDVMSVWGPRGATGAELFCKQALHVLQPQAFGLRQAAEDEQEAQQCQSSVQEECTWHNTTKSLQHPYQAQKQRTISVR